jgi:hypothetical protein
MTSRFSSEYARTEYSAASTDKGAIIHADGLVTFGRWSRDGFVVAHSKPSRVYASTKTAERSIGDWLAS